MAAKYYISTDGNSVEGPYVPAAIATLLRQGKIVGDTMVCPDGTENWAPLNTVAELMAQKDISATVPASQPAPSKSVWARADEVQTQIAQEEEARYSAPVSVAELRDDGGGENLLLFEMFAWAMGIIFISLVGSFALCYVIPQALYAVMIGSILISLVCFVFIILAALDESVLWMAFIFLCGGIAEILFIIVNPGRVWKYVAIRYLCGFAVVAAFAGAVLSPKKDPFIQKMWVAVKQRQMPKNWKTPPPITKPMEPADE
ncbi:MAG: DUF4339 domain-containing protein [Candidatus Methylacidiphilales bacterium]|nr:DUF4339 domain-containing protein [Candidatus Methylacidiphilales bacterium]